MKCSDRRLNGVIRDVQLKQAKAEKINKTILKQ